MCMRTQAATGNNTYGILIDGYAILCEYLQLRERLRPYIMGRWPRLMRRDCRPCAPSSFDFPEDERTYNIADAYLFGPDLLVAPVCALGARKREVYLPSGAQWQDAWTGAVHAGGASVSGGGPLERIPLYPAGWRGSANCPRHVVISHFF